jgi:hypothetical protein
VDFSSDFIIVSAYYGTLRNDVYVLHNSSSEKNPVNWGTCAKVVVRYWNENPPEKKFSRCDFSLHESPLVLKAYEMKRAIPIYIY